VERQSGAAAVSQLTTRPGRAALDAAAPFSATPAFHQHRDAPQTPVVDAPIQSGTSIRPHSALDVMTNYRAVVHGINLRRADHSCQTIAPARLSGRAYS
jgi:hypothetical protein